MRDQFRWMGLAALLVATACASAPMPTEEITRAKAAVEQAETAGAGEHAALEMKNAREKLSEAETLAGERDEVGARRAAEQAEVDALLAVAKTRRAKAQASASELQDTLEAMQEEMVHGT
ncbi:MAG TPA: DUF4398 domain-containing protein [Myxococcota bacterium]|nr:DUF4398 domain-containing protein [Myxococcota bacterium]